MFVMEKNFQRLVAITTTTSISRYDHSVVMNYVQGKAKLHSIL